MARKRKRNLGKLLLVGGVVAGGVIFWPQISQAVASAAGGAPSVGGSKPCDTSFIPGQRYVEYRNGVYNVVIGGRVVYTSSSQQDAEATYNRMVCGQ